MQRTRFGAEAHPHEQLSADASEGDPGLDNIVVLRYICTMNEQREARLEIERVQTGVRMEKRLLKVLKALAELKDLTLGDLLEGIVLHAFEGKAPFSHETLKEIAQLRNVYGLTLKATDSHKLRERRP